MTSRSPSSADRQAIEFCGSIGYEITARQLERWRQEHLIPAAQRRHLGIGEGTSSQYDDEALLRIGEVARRLESCFTKQKFRCVRQWMFQDGYPVLDEQALRADLIGLLDDTDSLFGPTSTGEWAEGFVEAGRRPPANAHDLRQLWRVIPELVLRMTDWDLLPEDPVDGRRLSQAELRQNLLGDLATLVTGDPVYQPVLIQAWAQQRMSDLDIQLDRGDLDRFVELLADFSLPILRRIAEHAQLTGLQSLKPALLTSPELTDWRPLAADLFINETLQTETQIIGPLVVAAMTMSLARTSDRP